MNREKEEQQFQSTSPMPGKPVAPMTYSFFDALKQVLAGGKITRQAWGNTDSYGYMHKNVLCIVGGQSNDGEVSSWAISTEDIVSEDWIILPEVN